MATLSLIRKNDADAAGVAQSRATVYDSIGVLPLSGNTQGEQAFIPGDSSTDVMYIWDGGGWYKMALIQTVPSFTTGPDASYDLATDGVTTTVITLVATDAEGIPVTFSATTDVGFDSIGTISQDSSVFTVTPFSEDSAGTAKSGTITFKATDGISIASALSTFSLVFRVENSNFTTMLLKASGNNGTNTTINDDSSNAHTVTVNGNAMAHALTPYHPGGYSTEFDGYMSVPSHADFGFGTGDFTIEFWHYPLTVSTASVIDYRTGTNGNQPVPIIWFNGNGYYYYYVNGSTRISGNTGDVKANQWYHVAISRVSGSTKMFVNGQQAGNTYNDSSISYNQGGAFVIGRRYMNAGTGWFYLDGYLRDVRVLKGTGLYSTSFDPPRDALTAITNTKLLLCGLPYHKDQSTSNRTVTTAGDIITKRFSPYDHQTYRPSSSHSAGVRFDGTGDFLTIGDTATTEFGSGDFTMELWYRGQDTDQYATLTAKGAGVFSSGNWSLMMNHSVTGDIAFYAANYSTGGPMLISGDVGASDGNWNHIAVVRNGNNWNLYVNGISKASRTSSITIADTSAGVYIGKDQYYGRDLSGFISDYRIVKGTAVYTSNFTPPTAPLTAISGTSLLTCNDQPNIYDAAQGRTTLLAGNAKSSTAQTKYASSSIALDGTGDYVYIDKAVGHFGTRDFTIEGWWYFNTVSAGYQPLVTLGQSADYQGWVLITEANNTIALYMSNGSSWSYNIGTSTVPTLNAWNHIAIVRNDVRIEMYLNGTSIGGNTSIGSNSTHTTNAGYLYAGHYPYFPGGARSFNGYIEDLRITKGLARYPFIPNKSTTLTNDAQTKLLVLHTGTSTDEGSSDSHTVTANGISSSSIIPAAGMYAWSFDGSNDYVQVDDGLNFATDPGQNFTIEGLVYFEDTSGSTFECLLGINKASDGTNHLIFSTESGNWKYHWNGGSKTNTGVAAKQNVWQHFALTYDGYDFRIFIDGALIATNATDATTALNDCTLLIGAEADAANAGNKGNYFDGIMSNFRISRYARYTASFTPPTELKA